VARRKVSVALELEAAQFNAEARGASATVKAVKNEVQDLDKAALLAQKGVAHLGDKTKHTAADMAVLKSEIKRVEAELRDLAREYEKTGDAAVLSAMRQKTAEMNRMSSVQRTMDRLNASQQKSDAAKTMGTLREEIKKVEDELKKLAVEYERAGSVATGSLYQERQAAIRDLRGIQALVEKKATQVTSSGLFGGGGFGGGLGGSGGPALIAGLVSLVAASAPAIGAAVGGAVLGAVGSGGIIGGIVAASKNSGVQAAASRFGQSVSKDFFASGDAFVGPVEQSLNMLADTVHHLGLKEAFATVAPEVTDIAHGLSGMATRFMPGFNAGLKASVPVLHEFSQDLPDVGAGLGYMFEQIGKGKGNVEGMRLIMGALVGTEHLLGNVTRALSDEYDHLLNVGVRVADGLATLPLVGGMFRHVSEDLHNLQDPANQTVAVMQRVGFAADSTVNPNLAAARSAAGLGDAYEKVGAHAKLMEMTTAGLAAETAAYVRRLDDQAKAVDANKLAFDDLMKTQSDYLNQILGSKNAMLGWKQDWLGLAASVKEHGRTLNTNTQDGLANAQALLQLAADAQRVRDELLKSPATASTANSAYLSMMKKLEQFAVKLGLSKKAAHDLLWQLEQFPGTITVGIDIVTGGESHAGDKPHGGSKPPAKKSTPPPDDKVPPRAAGGDVFPGIPYKINERGYETVTFPAAGTVHPANLVPWTGSGMTIAGGGSRTITVIVKDTSGRTLRAEVIQDARDRGLAESVIQAAYP